MTGIEVALIPGVLALGESIACQLGYAVADHQLNSRRSLGSSTGRSHPGIYSSNSVDGNATRSHCGIYCNPGPKQRNLAPVAETCPLPDGPSYYSDVSGSSRLDNAQSLPLTPRSVCESETESPCPTARLSSAKHMTMPPEFDGDFQGQSPSTRYLLMPAQERLCPPRSENPFGMATPMRECVATTPDAPTSLKISAGCGYLFTLSDLVKHRDNASNSTSSTCSDLDISSRTHMSSISSNASNTSEQQCPESVCSEEVPSPRGSEIRTRMAGVMPPGASPVDQTGSKARKFCRKAFAECDLDNLDAEMADVTKDLEALRASIALSKRVLSAPENRVFRTSNCSEDLEVFP